MRLYDEQPEHIATMTTDEQASAQVCHRCHHGQCSLMLIDSQRTANLARIRDNQRRSRARRKEYLQELESKYRNCEQVGVEASAEIQAAARRVLDENKRLRQLLKQQGLSDDQIDGMGDGTLESHSYPSAASTLEDMMGQRKPCGPGDGCGTRSDTETPPSQDGLRRLSMQTKPEPTSAPTGPMPGFQPMQQTPQQPFQPPSLSHQNSGSMSNGYALSPLSSSSSGVPTPANTHFPQHSMHSGYNFHAGAPPISNEYSMDYHDTMVWGDGQYQSMQLPQAGDSSSCYAAAGAIRTLKPDLGYELENELGCGNGMDCKVPNSRIFSIMDRYSESA